MKQNHVREFQLDDLTDRYLRQEGLSVLEFPETILKVEYTLSWPWKPGELEEILQSTTF